MKTRTYLCLMLSLSCWWSQNCPADNVLLLIADDYGVDSSGLYSGAGAAPTPNIDALAASGVRFTEFWANPICSPTRAAILTGRHGFRTGVGSPTGNAQIPLDEYSIASAVAASGHNTACIGKWHLQGNANGQAMNPNLMGFDDYRGSLSGGVPDYFDWTKTVNGVSSSNTNYVTSETVDDAIDWIDANGSAPWFCWVAFNAPHTPFHLPPAGLHSFDTLSGTAADIASNPLPYYQAAVEAMDTEIGRLLGAIDPAVLANTTVIFIGDNGTPGQVATDFERGQKGQLYQGGVHVPCSVSGASVAAPLGRTHDAFLHVSDLFSTIAELCGVDIAAELPGGVHIDSESFVPYLAMPDLPRFHEIQFAERFTVDGANQDGKTVRNDRYKLIRFDRGVERFYDLIADPLESTNLPTGAAGSVQAENYAALSAYLDDLLSSPNAPSVEAIQINNGDVQRSVLTEITIVFDVSAAIDQSGDSAFQIRNRLTNELASHESVVNRVDGKTEVTINFLPGPSVFERNVSRPTLVDGNYEIIVDASKVEYDQLALDGDGNGVPGDDHVFGDQEPHGVFRFFGDTDGDRDVDGQDFGRFIRTFLRVVGDVNFNTALDYDGDGDVDGQDYGQFGSRFLRTRPF